MAIEALAKEAHKVDGSYACGVNVTLKEKTIGCAVHFARNWGEAAYEVDFDKNGSVLKVYSRRLKDSTEEPNKKK